MAVHLPNERRDLLVAAAAFGVIGAVMTVLAPAQAVHASITGQAIGLYFIGSPASSIHSVEPHAGIQPLNGLLKLACGGFSHYTCR